MKSSVRVIEPTDCERMIYYLPTPKSPHGVDVDPSGEYIVPGGKRATVIPVHSFSKMTAAIEAQDFAETVDGIPVLRYESVVAGEVQNPGLGPLHTEFDGQGNAYTTAFIDQARERSNDRQHISEFREKGAETLVWLATADQAQLTEGRVSGQQLGLQGSRSADNEPVERVPNRSQR